MKIQDLHKASQLSSQLDNLRGLMSRDYANIIRNNKGADRVFFTEHQDGSGGKIELSKEEVISLQSIVDVILEQRKIKIELEIADL